MFLWVRDGKQSGPMKGSFKSPLVSITETEEMESQKSLERDCTTASSSTEETEVHKIIPSSVFKKNTIGLCFLCLN